MQTAEFFTDITFDPERPKLQVLLDTDVVREVRIAFCAGQELPEHKARRAGCAREKWLTSRESEWFHNPNLHLRPGKSN